MWNRVVASGITLLFVGAFVLSDRYAPPPMTPPPPRAPEEAERQVHVIETTPQHRRVKHPLGETWVPALPRRIVALSGYNNFIADGLVAMGIHPVGVEGSWMTPRHPVTYLARRIGDVPTVARGGTINLEAVLAARPDLILVSAARYGRFYSSLSKIAPTVVIEAVDVGGIDESVILDIGRAVGQAETAERVLRDYRKHLDEARKTLAKTVPSSPVVFLRFRRSTCVIYSRTQKVGPILIGRLGLTPDPMMPYLHQNGGWDVLSLERLSLLQAEHLFVEVDVDCEHFYEEVARTPMWRNIPGVKKGNVHRVPYDTWLGDGILAYTAIIDDVMTAMIPAKTADNNRR